MSVIHSQSRPLPSTARLLKATALALVIAAVLLVTTVLPAEYGIDPTGIGNRLGLGVLVDPEQDASDAPAPVAASSTQTLETDAATNADNAAEAAKAIEAFGAAPGQTFDTGAVFKRIAPYRRDTLEVTLPAGEGAEVKALLKTGDGVVFRWSADGEVALDMHGERVNVKNAWTSYSVEPAQREGSGTFIAPFDGSHGWYWQNRSSEPVTVRIEVAGFQEKLYRPGQS